MTETETRTHEWLAGQSTEWWVCACTFATTDATEAAAHTEQAEVQRVVCAHWPAWITTAPARCLACEHVPTPRVEHRDELCGCRLPECGQCTELVDKGLRHERMPRRPR